MRRRRRRCCWCPLIVSVAIALVYLLLAITFQQKERQQRILNCLRFVFKIAQPAKSVAPLAATSMSRQPYQEYKGLESYAANSAKRGKNNVHSGIGIDQARRTIKR